jgi:Leucine-rich repeat (LRR) protein
LHPLQSAATATHGETAKPAGASLPPPIAPERIGVITAELIHIEPVAQGSTLFVIDTAAVAATTTDESLARLLSPIRANIAELSLARSKITDASAPLLASLPNLRRLNLSATAITDATLTALANHPALEDLTLARTKTSDCASLASIPHLKHLYVWDTLSTPEVLVALSAKRPDLLIDSGAPSRDPS